MMDPRQQAGRIVEAAACQGGGEWIGIYRNAAILAITTAVEEAVKERDHESNEALAALGHSDAAIIQGLQADLATERKVHIQTCTDLHAAQAEVERLKGKRDELQEKYDHEHYWHQEEFDSREEWQSKALALRAENTALREAAQTVLDQDRYGCIKANHIQALRDAVTTPSASEAARAADGQACDQCGVEREHVRRWSENAIRTAAQRDDLQRQLREAQEELERVRYELSLTREVSVNTNRSVIERADEAEALARRLAKALGWLLTDGVDHFPRCYDARERDAALLILTGVPAHLREEAK